MFPERTSRSIDCTARRAWSFSRIRTSSSTTAFWTLVSVVVSTSITIERIPSATTSSTKVIPSSERRGGRHGVGRRVVISCLGGRRWLIDPVGEEVAGVERGLGGDLGDPVDEILVLDRDLDGMRDGLGIPPGLRVGGIGGLTGRRRAVVVFARG